MAKFVDKELARIRALVGEKGQVLGAVSGGVDSAVAAKLMHEAIGDRFHAVLVDNGIMRLHESEQVKKTLTEYMGINLTVVDASEPFLKGLKGITDNPEQKRKFIGNTFIGVFEAETKKIEEAAANSPKAGKIEWFLQGTLYPDVIESISFKGTSATIKTHHNVGGLPERMMNGQGLKLITSPRALQGRKCGNSEGIWAFGEVTQEQVAIARMADYIFIEEIKVAGIYDKISQAYAALLPCWSHR